MKSDCLRKCFSVPVANYELCALAGDDDGICRPPYLSYCVRAARCDRQTSCHARASQLSADKEVQFKSADFDIREIGSVLKCLPSKDFYSHFLPVCRSTIMGFARDGGETSLSSAQF